MTHWLVELFSHPNLKGCLIIAAKTAVIYAFLVLALRLLGKRELGQMNIYDLVLIIVIANAVQNAMVGDDTTLIGGMVAALTLLILNRLLNLLLVRSDKIERALVGEPILLFNDGQLIEERMRREGVTQEQLLAALREHGLETLEEVRMVVLEVDGSLSVVPCDAVVHKGRRHYRGLRIN